MLKPSKTWISNLGKKIGFTGLVLAIAVILAVWFMIVKLNEYLYPEPQFFSDVRNVEIKTYSLSGKVKSAANGEVTLTAGQVVTTKTGNEIRFFDKTATTGPDTKIFRRVASDRPDFEAAALTDIAAGKDITVYTTDNPYESDRFPAERIEIN